MDRQELGIILVHLGHELPPYLDVCIQQIRIWSSLPVYLVVFEEVKDYYIKTLTPYNVRIISTSELTPTQNHLYFLKAYTNYDKEFRDGYWLFVIERFYYMEEVMRLYKLDKAIHLEYDVMIYEDVAKLYPKADIIKGLALAFDNDVQGYPSFIIINNLASLELLNGFMAINCNAGLTDMRLLSLFRKVYPHHMESLPQIPLSTYKGKPIRKSINDTEPEGSTAYLANKFEELGGYIFDSLAIGQYIGGVDPRNADGICIIEYKNESSFYTVDELNLGWKQDAKGRWYLESVEGHRVANIHIHSKRLSHFLSNRSDYPRCDYKDVKLARLAD
jgi:hypothetical protein